MYESIEALGVCEQTILFMVQTFLHDGSQKMSPTVVGLRF